MQLFSGRFCVYSGVKVLSLEQKIYCFSGNHVLYLLKSMIFRAGMINMKKLLLVVFLTVTEACFADNILKTVYVTAKDGVKLHTYVSIPEKAGKYPVIISRTPYAKTAPDIVAANEKAMRKRNLRNFVRVYQECRGTGRSGGVFIPYVNERSDGSALLEWIRKQDFYNGEIYLEGGSYGASVHGALLNLKQPDIKGVYWRIQDTERYNIIYRNGFLRLRLHASWYLSVYKKNASIKRNKKAADFRKFPLSGMTPQIFGEKAADFEEVLLHPDPNDPFWKTPGVGGAEYSDALVNCKLPIFFVGAWHDIYITGMVDIWRKLDPEHRKKCVFMITPFDHACSTRKKDIEPELASPNGLPHEFAPQRESNADFWFEHLRSGTPLKHLVKGKISRYVLFGNRWETSEDIGANSKYCKFYFTSDRKLSVTAPTTGKISYKYDPRSPATFRGACHGNFGGVAIQAPPNSRKDIISFVSEPFGKDKIVEGDFTGRLHVSSTAPDTCFYIRLSVVKNGRAFGLRNEIDSICRTVPEFLPGKEAVIDFKIAPHHFKVAKGDQLRIDISSSCWPFFQLHSNFRGNQALQVKTQTAENTIIIGRSHIAIPFAPQK